MAENASTGRIVVRRICVAATILVLAAMGLTPLYTASGAEPPACTEKPFRDVDVTSPFCGEITFVRNNDMSQGYADGTFRPGTPMTRQAMAAFLTGAEPLPECTKAPFADVPVGHPFCREILLLKVFKVSKADKGDRYQPTRVVTRQSMAAFLARLGASPDLPRCTGAPFPDVPRSHPFCPEITWLKSSGITGGFRDGTFRPGTPVTRAEVAAFMYRFFE